MFYKCDYMLTSIINQSNQSMNQSINDADQWVIGFPLSAGSVHAVEHAAQNRRGVEEEGGV